MNGPADFHLCAPPIETDPCAVDRPDSRRDAGFTQPSHGFFLIYYGPEFTAAEVRKWLGQVGVGTLFIEPGSPWENGYVESFNGKFRAELLNREFFDTPLGARGLVERWRREYNTFRPHSALGSRPPAPEAIEPKTALGVR